MRALAAVALVLAVAHHALHRYPQGAQRTPDGARRWAGWYRAHPETAGMADCVEEGMDAEWLAQTAHRRPNRGHRLG